MKCIIFIVSAISRIRTLIGGDVFSEIDLLDECDRESKWCLSQSRVKDYMEELRTNSRSAGVTVVLNHWQRPAENLRLQLRAAIAGVATAVWVCIFGSPLRHEYDDVIVKIRQEHPDLSAKVSVIHSDVDFGVYGRFLLASSAKTRFVFVVDDDVAFPVSIVDQYLQRMEAVRLSPRPRPGSGGMPGTCGALPRMVRSGSFVHVSRCWSTMRMPLGFWRLLGCRPPFCGSVQPRA